MSEDILERLHGVADDCDLGTADVRAVEDAIVEIERLRGRVAAYEKDVRDAAGEYLVPIPAPGTPMAKLLAANVLMRRENARFNHLVNCVRSEVAARAAWLASLPDVDHYLRSCGASTNQPPATLIAAEDATAAALAEIEASR